MKENRTSERKDIMILLESG